jgi:protein-S-isoprenylcysteine O-methyltransferase Ste14
MRELIRVSEKIFLIILAATVIVRLAPAVPYHPQVLLFLFSELIGVFFILTQRKGDWAVSPYATGIAFFGTAAALLVRPEGTALAPEAVTVALTFTGAAIALFGKLSLRRSFGLVPANRGVKTGGLYAFVRHPIYCGYVINHVGLLLLYASWWNFAVLAFAWVMLWLRAVEEEKFLLTDPEYSAYAERVRYRIVPGLI